MAIMSEWNAQLGASMGAPMLGRSRNADEDDEDPNPYGRMGF